MYLKGLLPETSGRYVEDSRFWFESFQNWQSEFLSVFAVLILSIYFCQIVSSQPINPWMRQIWKREDSNILKKNNLCHQKLLSIAAKLLPIEAGILPLLKARRPEGSVLNFRLPNIQEKF
ncbi:DUF6766 family protein [Flavobacterium sp. 2755]|uniref:DUF6766 family protein n=1 Tax=Flavobacterium sp. 2755 TaxID=2817765 RepID=UPI00286AA76A|nr:DUF6766 family protein [Flavobacterium sp. 2755]